MENVEQIPPPLANVQAAGENAQPQQVSAVTVKLPDFWLEDAELWFSRIESVFRRARIQSPLTRFDYVMEKLPNEVLVSIRDVVRAINEQTEDPYSLIKERLLSSYKPSPWAQVNKLLEYPELGGSRPSIMMAAMLSLLPEGEQPGYLFKAVFLKRLPVEMREHLAAKEFDSPQAMAKHADSLWEARNSSSGSVSAIGGGGGSGRRPQSPWRGRSPSKKKEKEGLCFYHYRFRERATRCNPPCNWPGNGAAAGN